MKTLLNKLLSSQAADSPEALESIDSLKAKVRQIDALARNGALSPDAAAKARSELENKLAAAVIHSPAQLAASPRQSRPLVHEPALEPTPPSELPAHRVKVPPKLLMGLAAVLAFFVLLFMGLNGSPSRTGTVAEESSPPTNPASSSADARPAGSNANLSPEQIAKIVDDLTKKANQNPQSAPAWRELAAAHSAAGSSAKAVEAYKKALTIEPAHAQTLADLADSVAVVSGSLLGEPQQLITDALKADPFNVKALALAGTIAYDAKQYPQAIEFWDKAFKAATPDSPMAQGLKASLDEARQWVAKDAQGPQAAASSPSNLFILPGSTESKTTP